MADGITGRRKLVYHVREFLAVASEAAPPDIVGELEQTPGIARIEWRGSS